MQRKLKYKTFVCKRCGYTNTLQYKEAFIGETPMSYSSACPKCYQHFELDGLTSAESFNEFPITLIANNAEKDDDEYRLDYEKEILNKLVNKKEEK